MAIFKCKMCGGTLEVNNETVAVCQYCGTKQTLPKLDNEGKANLYDRANHFRRNNEFDKAMGIYEHILNVDNTDAESYWSLVLCRFGIEYVEDPVTRKRVPTINRAQFTSVFDDEDYKSALRYADSVQRVIYEQEAAVINEIQKGILAISQKEEPFDVFICYKETDNNGRRTLDSVLATELYHELQREGLKVFFSRITLEDKLGQEYEPYIFAALNSAKVMVVLGTKPEYFNAVWVKNEWSRYLALIKNGERKMLIPAYKDMNPYELPEEFSHLQAQDMSKLGFMQDLIHVVKKLANKTESMPISTNEQSVQTNVVNIEPLLRRVYIFLEDSDWQSADEYCEKVLDIEPECVDAYLGKLLAELKAKTRDELKNCAEPFDDSNNYQRVMKYADNELKAYLKDTLSFINTRNENIRLENGYNTAVLKMETASNEYEFISASQIFEELNDYKDAYILAEKCKQNAETIRKDNSYYNICQKLDDKRLLHNSKYAIEIYEEAIAVFESLDGWKDSYEKINLCREKLESAKEKFRMECIERERLAEEKRIKAKKRKKRMLIFASVAVPLGILEIIAVLLMEFVIIPRKSYDAAVEAMNKADYIKAYETFIELDGYKDSEKLAEEITEKYRIAKTKAAQAGDSIFWGCYEQDNIKDNGNENIEWVVLDRKGDNLFLISKYVLDSQPYNSSGAKVTWETCSLRTWLNDDFYNAAFSEKEKEVIHTTIVSADKNPSFNLAQGNNTQDKMFLLSVQEVNKYFGLEKARQCSATQYAISRGSMVLTQKKLGWWWLRTSGNIQSRATNIEFDGAVNVFGNEAYLESGSVRPVMWIDTSKIEEIND